MTAKQTKVLRTAFSDVYRVGDLEITQAGTEVPASDLPKIVEEAARFGVALFEVPPDAVKAESKNEGGSA
jgi:hypothetical protein